MRNVISIIFALSLSSYGATTARTIEMANAVATIRQAAKIAEVPADLLIAICFVESSLRPTLAPRMDGHSKSHGLCQVKLETAKLTDKVYGHRNKVTEAKLQKPFINAFYAAKYLKYQLKRYDGNWEHAVDAYNKGTAISAQSKYVRKVYSALHKCGVAQLAEQTVVTRKVAGSTPAATAILRR